MTQTTLSAATPTSPEPQGPALKECLFAPSAKSLEQHLDAGSVARACPPWRALLFTLRYEGPVRSCRGKRAEQVHTATSRTPEILIANLELKLGLTYRKLSPLRIPNRKFSWVLRTPWRIGSFPMRLHSLRRKGRRADPRAETTPPMTAFLIHGNAIKSRRNPFKNSSLRISNRR